MSVLLFNKAHQTLLYCLLAVTDLSNTVADSVADDQDEHELDPGGILPVPVREVVQNRL